MENRSIAVLPGPRTSFLDHLFPIAQLMEIPLVCTDEWVHTCAELFYPKAPLFLVHENELPAFLADYDTFYTVEPCRIHKNGLQFGTSFFRGEGKTIASFHGNPLKFRNEFWIERYLHDDLLLYYGEEVQNYFKEKGIWDRVSHPIRIGNIRKAYYEENKTFFQKKLTPHLPPPSRRKKIFYAPTWSYSEEEEASPFFSHLEGLVAEIPDEYQLLIKLHPFMHRMFPGRVEDLLQAYVFHERVHFFDEIPLVYPLFPHMDVFLGDYSSVACDFLSVNKPLFFLADKSPEWGTQVEDPADFLSHLYREDLLEKKRERAYHEIFGKERSFSTIKEEITQTLIDDL